MPATKLSQVLAALDAGDLRRAISIAARFPDLGAHRAAILDAHIAFTNPGFVRQLRRDPDALIHAGRAALMARYYRKAQAAQ
jgi:hypothetical protein